MKKYLWITSEERFQQLEHYSKDKGFSIAKSIDEAIDLLLKGKPSKDETPTLKPIITKYPAKCHKCANEIDVGSPAYWSKGVIICMDCFVQSLGDKALASKYLKMRELNKTMRALKAQADQYADLINEIKYEVKFAELSKKIDELLRLNYDYLKNVGEPQEKDLFKNLSEHFKEVKKEWEELKAVISAKIQPIRKKKVTY